MNCFFTIERCKLHLCQNHGNGNGKNKINITIPRDRPLKNEETKSTKYLTAQDGTMFTLPSR